MQRSGWGWVAVGVVFGLGCLWRWHYLFHVHPPTAFLYSDMKGYVETALRWFDPAYVQSIADTLYPPGTAYFLGWLHAIDPSWRLAIVVQCVLSCLVPLLLADTARVLYGRRAAWLTLIVSSGYFPFLDHAGYFFSEGPLLVAVIATMWALVRALDARRRRTAWSGALVAGVFLGMAAAVKSVVLVPALAVAGVLGVAAWRVRARRAAWCGVLVTAGIGFVLVCIPLSRRCTRLNEGDFCLISNNGPMNVLLGHAGAIKGIRWTDPQRHFVHEFGCPVANQRGYTAMLEFPFGAYESQPNLAAAWHWIRRHPGDALLLSIEHVFDLFAGTLPWPTSHTPQRRWINLFQQLYWIFILLPALYYLARRLPSARAGNGPILADCLMIAPLLGLMAVVFATKGEPRYRIAYDGFMIVVAAHAYTRRRDDDLTPAAPTT
ncbi:MAG: glycosyltransferase family 39 protein [Deltaproteobacteria bacterium]|nr:glycosyltransferase family 39 protein [Deltaproteobacteria bacterium]